MRIHHMLGVLEVQNLEVIANLPFRRGERVG